jgi:hypothetical protein
MELSQQTRQEL